MTMFSMGTEHDFVVFWTIRESYRCNRWSRDWSARYNPLGRWYPIDVDQVPTNIQLAAKLEIT